MSLTQFEFWSHMNARITEARDEAQGRIDNGLGQPSEYLKTLIARRLAFADVQQWAQEIYNDMNGIPNTPPEPQEPDDEIQL